MLTNNNRAIKTASRNEKLDGKHKKIKNERLNWMEREREEKEICAL